jgi:hypothetical protein
MPFGVPHLVGPPQPRRAVHYCDVVHKPLDPLVMSLPRYTSL